MEGNLQPSQQAWEGKGSCWHLAQCQMWVWDKMKWERWWRGGFPPDNNGQGERLALPLCAAEPLEVHGKGRACSGSCPWERLLLWMQCEVRWVGSKGNHAVLGEGSGKEGTEWRKHGFLLLTLCLTDVLFGKKQWGNLRALMCRKV